MYQVKVSIVDGEFAFFLPPEVAHRLGAGDGTHLYLVESTEGYLLTPIDPIFADQLQAAAEGMVRYRDALKELAE